MKSNGVWRSARSRRALLVAMVLLFLGDVVAIDRWGIKGTVTDAATGDALSDAWVLADFGGEQPLLVIPIGPHPQSRTGTCMGTRLTKTDGLGRFRFDVMTYNRALADKTAYIRVFKPGWLTYAASSKISSSFWTLSPTVGVHLPRGPGEQLQTTKRGSGFAWEKLSQHQRTRSDEVFETEGIVIEAASPCGLEGLPMAAAAMNHLLDISETFDERDRARGACRFAKKKAAEADAPWPFDCTNLPFKKPPGADVLAVEAEVEADRQRRRKLYPLEPRGPGTSDQ